MWDDLGDIDDEDHTEDDHSTTQRHHFTTDQQDDYMEQLHHLMDNDLQHQQPYLEEAIAAKDHDRLLRRWARTIEDSIFRHVAADQAAIRKHGGHGTVTIKQQRPNRTAYIQPGTNHLTVTLTLT